MATSNQSAKTPGAGEVSDKTDMGRVKRVAAGPVDEGKDSKPKLPTSELNKHSG